LPLTLSDRADEGSMRGDSGVIHCTMVSARTYRPPSHLSDRVHGRRLQSEEVHSQLRTRQRA